MTRDSEAERGRDEMNHDEEEPSIFLSLAKLVLAVWLLMAVLFGFQCSCSIRNKVIEVQKLEVEVLELEIELLEIELKQLQGDILKPKEGEG